MASAKPNPFHHLHILADDLTGACDAAAPFAVRGISTQVLMDQPFATSQAHVRSFCTATRDLSPEQAAKTIRRLTEALHADRNAELFKKIDSVFRGNTLVEIAATVAAFPDHLTVIAPAFPSQGRICHTGHLHLADTSGTRSIPLRASFATACLTPHWLPPSDDPAALAQALQQSPTRTVFCESVTHRHLQAVVHAADSIDRPILWIGSAGLAHALAGLRFPNPEPAPHITPLPGRILLLTGSDHPVTQHQLAALHSDAPVLRIQRGRTSPASIRTFVSRNTPIAALILNGGDTALQVCRALAISSLCLQGEYAPGIPIATAHGGPLQGTRILLKSGGFGEAGLLSRILRDLQS